MQNENMTENVKGSSANPVQSGSSQKKSDKEMIYAMGWTIKEDLNPNRIFNGVTVELDRENKIMHIIGDASEYHLEYETWYRAYQKTPDVLVVYVNTIRRRTGGKATFAPAYMKETNKVYLEK